MFQQLFVWSVIRRGPGRDCLSEPVLFGEKLPDLSSVLPWDTCQTMIKEGEGDEHKRGTESYHVE